MNKAMQWIGIFIASAATCIGWLNFEFPELFLNFYQCIPGQLSDNAGEIKTSFWGGDHMQVAYLGWKLKQALLGGPFYVYQDYYNFAAKGEIYNDFSIGLQYMQIALWSTVFGLSGGYNFAIIILPQILMVFACYFMLSAVSNSKLLCFVMAFGLAILPYRIYQVNGGHSGGAVMYLVPFYFGALLWHLGRPGKYWDLVAGLVLFLATISDEHQAYYLVVASAIIFTSWWIADRKIGGLVGSALRLIAKWRYLVLGLVFVIAYGVILDTFLLSNAGNGNLARSRGEIKKYSEQIPDFFSNSNINIGNILVPALLIAFLYFLIFDRKRLKGIHKNRYFPIFIAAFICMFLMAGIGEHWSQKSQIYEIFYHLMPFFKYQRVPPKMFAVESMLLALCFILVFEKFRRLANIESHSRKRNLYLVFCGTMIFACALQTLVYWRFNHVNRKFMILERLDSGEGVVIDYMRNHLSPTDIIMALPITERMSRYPTITQNLAVRTNMRFAQGYTGTAPTHFLKAIPYLTSFNDGSPSRNAAQLVRDMGFTHILAVKNAPARLYSPGYIEKMEKLGWLRQLICDHDFCLYEIKVAELLAISEFNRGWTGPQTYRKRDGRWMLQEEVQGLLNVSENVYRDFGVLSQIEFPAEGFKRSRTVEIVFKILKEESLWVIEPGHLPREFPKSTWKPLDQGDFVITFEVNHPKFFLGVKEGWVPAEIKSAEFGRYGHLIRASNVTR